ncbi:MAG: DUF3017 domain-containing protein [Microlunatus sp.]|nr:DUF3017 domain-containing protein [Microlunatus sp.]MDN5771181.1 DUF3017 domain-containing protein [Microlunatus sp.]MDN5804042.1 DUF3017 domain-containing protein [Microlunatus sp.]
MAGSAGPVARTGHLWPLLVVGVGVAIGLIIAVVGEQTWRIGCLMSGTSLLVGAVIRGALPAREAGLLQVRSRPFDITVLTLGGIAIIALSIVVPPAR